MTQFKNVCFRSFSLRKYADFRSKLAKDEKTTAWMKYIIGYCKAKEIGDGYDSQPEI